MLTLLPAALEARMQRDAGVSHFDYLVLRALSMAPDRTLRMSEVSPYTGSTLSRLSNAVSRLEQRGWVQRRTDPSDGRYALATLTEEGQGKVVATSPAHVAQVRRLVFDPLARGQQRQPDAAAQSILRARNAHCPSDWTLTDGAFPAGRK